MGDLIGVTSILTVSLITFFIGSMWRGISTILFVALIVRILLIILGNYIVLPDSNGDGYESVAWTLSQNGLLNVLINFKGPNSYFISWIIAIPYSIFGRSLLLAQSISLFFGMGCIFLSWLLAKKIFDMRVASKVGWIVALFPSLALYSTIVMREVYVTFFLLVAFFGIVNWVRSGSFKSIIVALLGFVGGAFFHGGIFIGALIFLSIVLKKTFLNFMKVFLAKPIKLKSIYIIILITIFSGSYFTNNIKIPKLGYFKDGINFERIYTHNEKASRGSATYPKWVNIKSPEEFLYKAPIRAIFFLFSPLPWQIRSPSHLIGLLDGLLYLLLIFFIFRNRKMILQDKAAKYILLILIGYIFVFGLGISNFGTSIRHRSKFVIGLILLAAPFIPRIVLSTKKIKKNIFHKL